MQRWLLALLLAFLICGAEGTALAEAPSPAPQASAPSQEGRFSMSPTQGGFLRLDKETGAVSFCAVENGLSLCRIGADERSALENEIAKLRRENAELKAAAGQGQGGFSPLPKEEDFERAMSFTERFMRRMMRLFKEESNGEKS
ncbi:hypothetical protein [Methylocystis heyeri]|uniref:Uncharacterized protein n=1 Tax=Methylocystis heyeri TaxID=391905 RepID=A0A6B8KF20_9HYPH|nr:hypothetical protein [Methylocystis heyeri]QGM46886.1 hypothetical protein H2LOC_014950 [Methylocystis heyeri]